MFSSGIETKSAFRGCVRARRIDEAEDDLRLDQVHSRANPYTLMARRALCSCLRHTPSLRPPQVMDLLLRPAFISEDSTIGFAIDEMVSLRAGCLFTLDASGDVAGVFTVRPTHRAWVCWSVVGRWSYST